MERWRLVGGQTEGFQKKMCLIYLIYFILQGFWTTKKMFFLLKVSQLAEKTAEARGPEWELCSLVRLVVFWLFALFIAALTATVK